MSPEFVAMMEAHGVHGRGASLGYPHYVTREGGKLRKQACEPIWKRLGVTVDYFDVGPFADKPIITLDLNDPITPALVFRYDFLVNPGTFEHVWNPGNAFAVAYKMVKPGGLMFLHGRLGMFDNGYWSQTKQTVAAFCEANGAELLQQKFDGAGYIATVLTGQPGVLVTPQENDVR